MPQCINQSIGEPVSKQVVYDILETRCYDIDPDMPWSHQKRLAKVAVLPQDIPRRLAFGKHMLSLKHTPYWYWRHVIWTDICNSVLPTTIRKANAQALSQRQQGGKSAPPCWRCGVGGNVDLVSLCIVFQICFGCVQKVKLTSNYRQLGKLLAICLAS